jgi:hypothetical protein
MSYLNNEPNTPKTNLDKLATALGYNPTRETPGASVFQDALAEVNKERNDLLKGRMKAEIIKANELANKLVKLDREYQQQRAKCDKELGKLVNMIMAAQSGQPMPTQEEKGEQQDDKTAEQPK